MNDADNGKLGLPEFQRDFVWKTSSVIKLISSLFNKYPIGGLLFMEDDGARGYEFRSLDGAPNKEPRPSDCRLVLDGQQRLTSCYRAFYGTLTGKSAGRYYFMYREYLRDPTVSGSAIESLIQFEKPPSIKKRYDSTTAEQTAGLFPLDIILRGQRGTDYSQWLSGFTFSEAKGDSKRYAELAQIQALFIRNFAERITGCHIHYESISKEADAEVICAIFETINTTGKKLTVFDLLVARCYKDGVRLRDLLMDSINANKRIRQFDPKGEDLCNVTLPRIIGLFEYRSCKRGDLLQLDGNHINKHWSKSVAALEAALELIATKFGAFNTQALPLIDIVAPMAFILSSDQFKDAGQSAYDKLTRWYWRSVFSGYFATSGETKAARAVREWLGDGDDPKRDQNRAPVKGWLEDEGNEPESVKAFSLPSNLLQGVAREDNVVYAGVMTMLFAHEVKDFSNPHRPLTAESVDKIEDHHIFPQKYLNSQAIRGDEANQIANRTPILGTTNRSIGDKAPNVYLNDTAIVGKIPAEVLSKHHIPVWVATKPSFSCEVFDRFIAERQTLLLKEISSLVNKQPEMPIDG